MKKIAQKSTSNICKCYYKYVDIYEVHIVFYYGSKEKCIQTTSKFLSKKDKVVRKDIIDHLKKYIGSPEDTTDYFCMDFIIDSTQWIFISIGDTYELDDPYQLGAISHECIHAAIDIAREHGFYNDDGNSEPIAYLQDFIYTDLLYKLKKTKKENKQ